MKTHFSDNYILGVSCFYHDSSAALIRDNKVVAAAQEERFSRSKFDNMFPRESINFCLNYAGINIKDVRCIAFYEEPYLKLNRILNTKLNYDNNFVSFKKSIKNWIENKFNVEEIIFKELDEYDGEIVFYPHHLSHAASAFFPSPFKQSSVLIIDAIGEWACTSIGLGEDSTVKIIQEQRFPHSLGLFYSTFTQYLGFKVDSGEYKVMGLAPYGEPIYKNILKENIISINNLGVIELNPEYFDFFMGERMISNKVLELFDMKMRKPDEELEKFHFDLASSIQEITEEAVQNMAAYCVKQTGVKNLVMAGGVALNCVSNGKLLKNNIVDDLWIQPCAGDGGGSLGAAFLASHHHLKISRYHSHNDSQMGSYLGPSFSRKEILNTCDAFSFNYVVEDHEKIVDKVSDLIIKGKIVGIFFGRMEYGPRALGARSIIADARNSDMQSKLNLKTKFRESFRPFAPIVLEEYTTEWFEDIKISPYMMQTTLIQEEKLSDLSKEEINKQGLEKLYINRSKVPAITHVDNSSRIQTVTKNRNGKIYDILYSFYCKTNCPILINTSFNVRGEPIVCTPYDALRCFMNTNIDYLVMEDVFLKKSDQNYQLVDDNFMEYLKKDL